MNDTRKPEQGQLDDRTTLVQGPLTGLGATDEGVHYLVVAEGLEPGRMIELSSQAITLGRQPPADVVLRDVEISRSHCRLQRVRDFVAVTDLNSMNGTFVDGVRVDGAAILHQGSVLQVGGQLLRYEQRSRREIDQSRQFDRSLERASQYIQSLLPAPIADGPVRTEWLLLPSARLGGDAFGYHAIDGEHFMLYLLDVSGHGAEAAMLAVAVMNTLRQRALPETDFRDPAQVMRRLNAMFQMDEHGSMFFTLWYGVYSASRRTLTYGTAGHHPAYLVGPERGEAIALRTPGLAVGVADEFVFTAATTTVPPESRLYVFSDGVFEIVTAAGTRWELDDLLPLMLEPPVVGQTEPQRLLHRVHAVARRGPLDDDFSLLVTTFT